jgi:hypothetical protein
MELGGAADPTGGGGFDASATSSGAAASVAGDTLFALAVSGMSASRDDDGVVTAAVGLGRFTSAVAPSPPVDTAVICPQLAAHPAIATVSTPRNRTFISAVEKPEAAGDEGQRYRVGSCVGPW